MAPSDGRAASVARWDWLMMLGCAVALTGLLTYPTVAKFDSAGRLNSDDGNFSIWNVAWVAHALLDDPAHLFDANIFYPNRHTLTYSELNLVAGALAVPVYAATRSALAGLNSAILIGLALSFVAMWALVRRLTGSAGAGLVAATGYTFSAYTSSHTAQIQLLMIFGFPLTMLAFHRLVDRPGVRAGIWLGGAVALTALACGYYGVYIAGVLGVATIAWAVRRPAYWIGLGAAAITTAALVLPVIVPYLRDRAADGVVRVTNTEELQSYSADVRAHLTSSTDLDVKWYGRLYKPGERQKEVLFPGIVLLLLAAVGLAGRGRPGQSGRTIGAYLALAVLAFWASFGPGAGLYSLLMRLLPGMSLLRVPARLAIVDIFALSVLAGFGYARLAGRRAWLAPALLIALAIELWVPWPLHDMPAVPRAYVTLANLPRGAVVELPFAYQRDQFHQHAKPMLMSTYHWQPLVNGYSDYIPTDFPAIAEPLNFFPDAASFEIMRARGVRYVIWKVDQYGPYKATLLARLPAYARHLRLITDDQGVRLYEIVSWPAAGPRP